MASVNSHSIGRRLRTGPGRLGYVVSAALGALALAAAPAALAASPGSLDPSFGTGGAVALSTGSQLFGVAVQSNGDPVVAGSSGGKVFVERYTTAGKPNGAYTGPAGSARAVAIQSNGDIVIAGTSGGALLVERLTSGLTPDSSFGSGGIATALGGNAAVANGVAIGPSGNIVAAGSANPPATQVAVASFSSSGSVQWSQKLNLGNFSVANGVAVQPADGKILLAGSQRPLQLTNAILARLNSSGGLDTSFASGVGALTYSFPNGGYTAFTSVALQSNGQIVVGGAAAASPNSQAVFMRFNSNGSRDSGFGSGGVAAIASNANVSVPGDPIGAYGVGIAGGGRIVGAGNFENTGVEVDAAIWTLTPAGQPDPSLAGGTARTLRSAFEQCALAVAPDGSLVSVGNSVATFPDTTPCSLNASEAGFVVRYIGYGPPPVIKPPPPPPPPALSTSLKGVAKSDKTSTVAKKGLKVSVSCNEACTTKLSLTISSGTAKKLKIQTKGRQCKKSHGKTTCKTVRGYFTTTIASGKGSVRAAGTATTTLKLNKSYVKALEKQKSVRVNLQVSVTSSVTHKSKTLKQGITFKR